MGPSRRADSNCLGRYHNRVAEGKGGRDPDHQVIHIRVQVQLAWKIDPPRTDELKAGKRRRLILADAAPSIRPSAGQACFDPRNFGR